MIVHMIALHCEQVLTLLLAFLQIAKQHLRRWSHCEQTIVFSCLHSAKRVYPPFPGPCRGPPPPARVRALVLASSPPSATRAPPFFVGALEEEGFLCFALPGLGREQFEGFLFALLCSGVRATGSPCGLLVRATPSLILNGWARLYKIGCPNVVFPRMGSLLAAGHR